MEDVKNYTDQELIDQIAVCRMRASEIREEMQYADGQAYYQDKDRLHSVRQRQGVLQGEMTRRKEARGE